MIPPGSSGHVRASIVRGAALFGLWVVLIGVQPADLVVGLLTAAAATWTSLHLLPRGAVRVRFAALPALALHFVWQSVVAGWDVARRAFDPRLPLRPGFVAYPVKFAPGPARNAFAAMTSLLPGTVPCGDEDGKLLYHCLDVGPPVADDLAAEETRLARVLEASRDA
ncbi:MAG: Na+/H+ antiporter subunit E [Burkholderiales bacterium]